MLFSTEVAFPHIVYSEELQMYEFCAETLVCRLIRGVDIPPYGLLRRGTIPRIVYSRESLMTAGSPLVFKAKNQPCT